MSAAFTAEHSPSHAPHTEEPGLGPCPPSFDDSMCCSPRTLGRGAQAIRKTCSRLSPGTFLLAKWTRSHGPAGAAAGGQLTLPTGSIPSLRFQTPARRPQGTDMRVSFRPAGLSTNRTACLFDVPDSRPLWWSQTGSNRRPHACKARALPTELQPRGTPLVAGVIT